MKKISKSKKGFTLVEMVLVIAIIVILASVLFLSITGYISKAHQAATAMSLHNQSIADATAYIDNPNAV